MLQRLIASDGIVIYSKNQEIYSVITCIDGLDYIIELVNNEKCWKLYNSIDDDKTENNISISETELPLLENPQDDVEIQNVKKKGRKPKVVYDNDNTEQKPILNENINIIDSNKIEIEDSNKEDIQNTPCIVEDIEVKKTIKIIKKKGRPPKIKPIEIIESESSEEEVIIKKKIIKLKEKPQNIIDVDNDNKKLSDYHAFIREFLSKNSDIVWNERMKAANESWKSSKSSNSSKKS
jgi:hypothetical protein